MEKPGLTSVAVYKYDALGRRIEKNVDGVITKYLYDGLNIIAEYDENNNVKAQYIHNLSIDDQVAMVKNGQTYYYHKDGLGSITSITDSSGVVVQKYEYDSFGNLTLIQNPAFKQIYTYTGREWDEETGLLFYRARTLDSKTGTFTTKDPIGFKGGDTNLYRYVWNRPTRYIDPFGLSPSDSWDPRYHINFWSNFFGGANDFYKNYQDMKDANTIGADKYFHCMANCQATKQGFGGREAAEFISESRELFDEYIKGDPRSACNEDREANRFGRKGKLNEPCKKVCEPLRPRGLNPKY